MPATPSNLINTDLAVGGTLTAPTISATTVLNVTGNINLTGNEIITGNLTTTGNIVSNNILALLTATGSSFSFDYSETLVTLSTVSETTNFSITLPAGAVVLASAMRVVTAITGTADTDLTLNVNPTSGPDPVGFLSAPFTAGTSDAGVSSTGGVRIDGLDVDDAQLVLSNPGGDNPTGGSVRVTLYYMRATASSS